jgi:hypothetical protein
MHSTVGPETCIKGSHLDRGARKQPRLHGEGNVHLTWRNLSRTGCSSELEGVVGYDRLPFPHLNSASAMMFQVVVQSAPYGTETEAYPKITGRG